MSYFSELAALQEQAINDLTRIADDWDTLNTQHRSEQIVKIEGILAELIIDVAACIRSTKK